jgi:transposase
VADRWITTSYVALTASAGEGRVNHINMLKRQMFGRASLPLRTRVLLTASR